MLIGNGLVSPILAAGFVMFTGIAPITAAEITPPTDAVAKAAFDVLDKSCARCHQEGRLSFKGKPYRERPSSGFGNVLKLEELAKNPKLVIPGNPYGSFLFKQIVDKEMPYDVMYEGADAPSPNEADIKALETWIKSLGTTAVAACDANKFISNKDLIGLIAADLEKLSEVRARGTRYLTLTHLKNICTADEALKVYRQGAVKLLNSLSRSSDVVRLETIDPEQTIIRFNIDDLGWSAHDWDTVIGVYPYNTQPQTQLLSVLHAATGTRLPYVRADWFAFTASQPPLYNKLLKLPRTFQALAREEGVDIEANIRKYLAQRAGFQKSGVSQNNRLIERHTSRSGYFWTSYDFAGNRGKQSLFEFPLGPGGRHGFDHDGGETIFSLPNGFQAYYLNNAKGTSLDKGPTAIVRDLSRKDLAVTNGISCMGCHDQGMRKAKDDIRAAVINNRVFPKHVREAVEALYPPHEKMDRIIEGDGKRFTNAMIRAGLEPALKLNGVEMINALAKRYEDDVSRQLAAAELGLTIEQLEKAADDASRPFKPLLRRFEQGLVPRDQFEIVFTKLAENVTDDDPVHVAAGGEKVAVPKPVGRTDLSLTSDKDAFQLGDTPVFTVLSKRDCFLTLTNVDEKGEGTVLFPNKFQQNNRIRANVAVRFPASDAPFQYRMKDRGIETVIAVCSDRNTNVDGIVHNFAEANFTSTGNYTRRVARAIVLEAKNAIKVEPKTSTAGTKPIKSTDARHISRAAITLEVR
jgi:hypothetical protein